MSARSTAVPERATMEAVPCLSSVIGWPVPLSRIKESTSLIACVIGFSMWALSSGRFCSLKVPLFLMLFCIVCLATGRIFVRHFRLVPGDADCFPTSFLFGFFLVNSLLYLLAWALPTRIVINFFVLIVGLMVVGGILGPGGRRRDGNPVAGWPAVVAVLVSLGATTLWCQASLRPVIELGRTLVSRPWIDSFFHICQIRMMREGHGAGSMQDVRMADRPAAFYHYATYTAPALLSAATDMPTDLAYAGFLVPVGIFLTGLAAFSLVRSWWGDMAGLGATVALLLTSDGSVQLLANPFLGYHWLQQINPGGAYGVACMALCWLLMIRGCSEGRLSLIALSFLFAALCLHYKAHIFVANALLLWVFPAFFVRGRRWWARIAWFAFATLSYAAAIAASPHIPGVPLLRFDGSGLQQYMGLVSANLAYGADRLAFVFDHTQPSPGDYFRGARLLFFGTFGLFGWACAALLIYLPARSYLASRASLSPPTTPQSSSRPLPALIFPIMIIGNYLGMSLGLAIDTRNTEHPEELLHRPLVWAYFAVACWVGGAISIALLGTSPHLTERLKRRVVVLVAVLCVIPVRFGPNVQQGPNWGRQFTNLFLPRSLEECATYLRTASARDDVVQESGNDPRFILSALAERRAYAIAYFDGVSDPILSGRIAQLDAFRELTTVEEVRSFAEAHRIRWYVLSPTAEVRWPREFVREPAFSSDGYRVFRFR